MEGTRIVLVRHGESRAQERRVVGGHAGCTGLSDLGRRQVGALADRLRATGELADTAALYASIMPRAIETAEIIADAVGTSDVVTECDFCEHHPGDGDGMTWVDFAAAYPEPEVGGPDVRRCPGSETWSEMARRVARALDTVLARHPGETVDVACHGGVIVHSMFRWLGLSLTPDGEVPRAWISPANA